jgi:hypothetical protein
VWDVDHRIFKTVTVKGLAARASHNRARLLCRQALVGFPHRIFPLGPILLIAPSLEIGLAALGQSAPPRGLESGARSLKARGAPISLLTRIAARIKPAVLLPRLSSVCDARSLDDHADANAGIVDVPRHGPIVDALAGEGGRRLLYGIVFSIHFPCALGSPLRCCSPRGSELSNTEAAFRPCIGFRSRAIAISIFKARLRTDDVLRTIW